MIMAWPYALCPMSYVTGCTTVEGSVSGPMFGGVACLSRHGVDVGGDAAHPQAAHICERGSVLSERGREDVPRMASRVASNPVIAVHVQSCDKRGKGPWQARMYWQFVLAGGIEWHRQPVPLDLCQPRLKCAGNTV